MPDSENPVLLPPDCAADARSEPKPLVADVDGSSGAGGESLRVQSQPKEALLTFVNTEKCQLRCKYCYVCKHDNQVSMDLPTAFSAIDYILKTPELFPRESIILNFIGGEPFIEVDRMTQIMDYFLRRTKEEESPWNELYMLYITTNGVMYNDERVRRFVERFHDHLEMHYSFDGPREKHDLDRVYADGRGSWADVRRNLDLWRKDFPNVPTNTEVSHASIPLIVQTAKYFWDLGFKGVSMGLVFDPVWEEGDDALLERQMVALADYLLENDRYKELQCGLFDRSIGFWIDPAVNDYNGCGIATAFTVTPQGNIHACSRTAAFCLEKQTERTLGTLRDGINANRLRPYITLTRTLQSTQKCIDCEVGSGCPWRQGANFENADTDTIYQRATHACKVHRARVRGNNYFWNKADRLNPPAATEYRTAALNNPNRKGLQYLYVLLDSTAAPFCFFPNDRSADKSKSEQMSMETLKKVVYYSLTNNLVLNLPLGHSPLGDEVLAELKPCRYVIVRPYSAAPTSYPDALGTIDVFNLGEDTVDPNRTGASLILRTSCSRLRDVPDWLAAYSTNYDRIQLTVMDIDKMTTGYLDIYKEVLDTLARRRPEREDEKPLQLSCLTDRLQLDAPADCDAGIKHATVAPDGQFYLCPGFYFSRKAVGYGQTPFTDIDSVLATHQLPIKNRELLQRDHSVLCTKCDAFQCKRCVWLNKLTTLELNTPSREQCVMAHLERNASRELLTPLGIDDNDSLPEIKYLDPFDQWQANNQAWRTRGR